MSKKLMLAAGVVMSAAAGTAVAADAAFDNHMTSTPMVSPAQLYQTDALKTDFAVGFNSESGEAKPTAGDKATDTTTGTRLFAAGIYNIQAIGLRAGLVADYVTGTNETKDPTGAKLKVEGSTVTLSPTFAYPVGPVALGVAIDVVTQTAKAKLDGAEEVKTTYNTVRPGVLFKNDDLEAGLTFRTKSSVKIDGEEPDPKVENPAMLTVHGRYAVDKTMAFGAIVKNEMLSDTTEDAVKDRTSLTATGEMAFEPVKVEADLGYNMSNFKKDEELTGDTLGTMELGAAVDYLINKQASVGGGLGYEFGSGKNDTSKVEYAVNTLSVLVRGDMKF